MSWVSGTERRKFRVEIGSWPRSRKGRVLRPRGPRHPDRPAVLPGRGHAVVPRRARHRPAHGHPPPPAGGRRDGDRRLVHRRGLGAPARAVRRRPTGALPPARPVPHLEPDDDFVWYPATLEAWLPEMFHRERLVARISGVGIVRW